MVRQPAPATRQLLRRSRKLATQLRQRLSHPQPLWLGGPLALAVAGFGIGLHHFGSASGPSEDGSDPLLQALVAAPVSPALNRLEAARARQRYSSEPGHPQRVALTEPDQAPPLQLEIRVALLEAGAEPRLSATAPWQLRTRHGGLLQQGAAGEPVSLAQALQAGEAWLVTGRAGALLADGRVYGGSIRILPSADGVLLVNHIGLESYIAAVVGSEMPSGWPLEALKAQAVAARSYALAHMARPANRNWHLGDTTRWQAYRGLERVTARTQEAAHNTAGLILSYQGGIVESLYAANREIALEAHGHLGASMSQQGARALAEDGYRYNAILGRYYPGASLARLRAGTGGSGGG